jgi:hypothetical protein
MTEAQLRKLIRKELLKEMEMGNMPHNDEKPSLGFSGKEMAGMVAGGVAGNAAFIALQNFFRTHPEVLEAIKTGALSVSEVLNKIMMMENNTRK